MIDKSQQLLRLAELLEKGLISREQFDEERDVVLSDRKEQTNRDHSATDRSHDDIGNIPKSIGSYLIIGEIGQGGMGAVYRGRHRNEVKATQQGGDVAIKVMHPQYSRNEAFRKRFEREASLGLALDHPGIVKVHDLVVDSGTLALIMECVKGRELAEMIGVEVGPIPWERAQPLFTKILQAMACAHDNDIIHRDLKSENILILDNNEIKILDFGIAKKLGSSETKTGTGMGTINYMAPEQFTDAKSVDHRADIYALGMTLYEMLAGQLPWDEDSTDYGIMTKKLDDDLPPPTDYYPHIPNHIVQLIKRATSANKDERPQSVQEFIDALNIEWETEATVSADVLKVHLSDKEHNTPKEADLSTQAEIKEMPTPSQPEDQTATGIPKKTIAIGFTVLASGFVLFVGLGLLVLSNKNSKTETQTSDRSEFIPESISPMEQAISMVLDERSFEGSTYMLDQLSCEDLWALRNWSFARHGYAFSTTRAQNYFSARPEYQCNINVNGSTADRRTQVDRANTHLIKDVEESLGCKTISSGKGPLCP